MNLTRILPTTCRCHLTSALCAVVILPYNLPGSVRSSGSTTTQAMTTTQAVAQSSDAAPIPSDQLDSLVAPIALYPDPLLAQMLAASTYPLELMQLQQWLTKNPGLKDQALADAVARQPWDPTVQAMAAFPDVVKRLTDDIQWTTDLGNAFLAQQSDVMNAVQRMRSKAAQTGSLKSGEQQVVRTETVENKPVIVIEQANPDVVYVPSYNPTVVYGPPVYPYPPIYYPSPGYYAAGAAISFGVGVAAGAAYRGGWGWGAGWGHNDITVNNNNVYNRNANLNNRAANASNQWQHQAQHRGGTPYRDSATANRYGGTTRGDSLANRQAGARQQLGAQGGNLKSNAAGGLANRTGTAGTGGTLGAGNRAGTTGLTGTTGTFNRPSTGADRIGQSNVSRPGGGNSSAFGGGSQRFNGDSARFSSQRGSSSLQPRGGGGGGFSRSGGGGFSRGGGGGRRR